MPNDTPHDHPRLSFLVPRRIRRITLPFLGRIAWVPDPGAALNGDMLLQTELWVEHRRNGKVIARRSEGTGLITVTLVNTLVSDAVTGSSVVPTLARFKYMDSGTGSTAATDGDTGLQTPITSGPARVVATLTNGQSATTGNHTAKLTYTGTITYNGSYAINEWGLFDAAGSSNPVTGGNMADHKITTVYNVVNTDAITFAYSLSLPSNS